MAESIAVRSGRDAPLLNTGIGAPDRSNDLTFSVISSIAIHALVMLAWPGASAPVEPQVEPEQTEYFTLAIMELPPPELVEPPAAPLGESAGPGAAAASTRPTAPRTPRLLGLPVLPAAPPIPEVADVPQLHAFEPELASASVPDIPAPVIPLPVNRLGGSKSASSGGGNGGAGGDEWSDYAAFSPMMVKPEIRNRAEVARFLERRFQPILRKTGATGVVMLAFWIDEKGKAQRIEIVSSSGHVELDEIALLLSDVIRFSPAIHMGAPVRVRVEVPIRFQERS